MKKITSYYFMVAVLFVAIGCQSVQQTEEKTEHDECLSDRTEALNTLSSDEQSSGWILLFNGKTSQGWRGMNKDHLPAVWEITDCALHCKSSDKGENSNIDGGDILYDKKFRNFHLKLEWKIASGGNSGIFYLGQEVTGWAMYKTAPEMQILDNIGAPDAKLGKNGSHKAGSLYDLIPANPQNTKPAGEWNSIEIICNKGAVIHKQNGETVVEYHLWTNDWKKMVAESKFFQDTNPNWVNVAEEGFIGLQDHGNDVWFRNIKIKEL